MTKLITYRNETLSVRQIAARYGRVCYRTVCARLARGESIEFALFGQYPGQECITINGVTRRIDAWCKLSGIKRETFYTRRRKGWSIERCVMPLTKHMGITAWGRTQSAVAWQRDTRIHARTIMRRIRVIGLPPEVALTLPVEQIRKRKTIGRTLGEK